MTQASKQEQWIRIFDVPETKFHKDGYTVYKIISTLLHRSYPEASTSLEVWRRYSAILRLHKEIIKISNHLQLPERPPAYSKPSLINRFDEDVIETRRRCALTFFRYCAKYPSIYASDEFTQFFQDDGNKKRKKLSLSRFKDKKSPPNLASSLGISDNGLSLYSQMNENTSSSEDLSGRGFEEQLHGEKSGNMESNRKLKTFKHSMGTSASFPENLQTFISHSANQGLANGPCRSSVKDFRNVCDRSGISGSTQIENEGNNVLPIYSNKFRLKRNYNSHHHSTSTELTIDRPSLMKDDSTEFFRSVRNDANFSQPYETFPSGLPVPADASNQNYRRSKEISPKRKKDVRTRTVEYLQKAEKLISKFSLREGKTWQNACTTESSPKVTKYPAADLKNYRVVGPSGNIIVALDLTTQETVAIKVLEKVCEDYPKDPILPVGIPFMVPIIKYHETKFAIYLILKYVSGGKLWNHLKKFIKQPPPVPPASLNIAKGTSTYEGQRLLQEEQGEPQNCYKSSNKLLDSDEKITLEMLKALYEEEDREKALLNNALSASEQNLQEEFAYECAQPSCSEYENLNNCYFQNEGFYSNKNIDKTNLKLNNCSQNWDYFKRSFEHLEDSFREFNNCDVGPSSSSFSAGLMKEECQNSCKKYARLCPLEGSNHRCSLSNIVDYSLDQNEVHDSNLPNQSLQCPKSCARSKSLENLNPGKDSREKKLFDIKKLFEEKKNNLGDCKAQAHYQDSGSIGSNTLSGVSDAFSCSSYNPLPDTDASELGLSETGAGKHNAEPSSNLVRESKKPETLAFDVNFLIKNSKKLIDDVNKTLAKSKQQLIKTFTNNNKDDISLQEAATHSLTNSANSITSCYLDMDVFGDVEKTEPTSVYLSAKSNSTSEPEMPNLPRHHSSYKTQSGVLNKGASKYLTSLEDTNIGLSTKLEANSIGLDFTHKHLLCSDLDLVHVWSPSSLDDKRCYSSVLSENSQGIPEGLVRVWVSQVISAMDEMHSQEVIWKDFSPGNLLLDEGGSILVTYKCSYGEASSYQGSQFAEWNSEDAWVVSLGYISPELFNPVLQVTPASDWWSVGALLFHLLTGKDLASCYPCGITSHTQITFESPISEEAASLITNLLCVNPSERLGSSSSGVQEIKDHPFFLGIEWPE